jgi:hypothetical protein
LEVEMNHRVEKKGFRVEEVPIHYRARLGAKKLKLTHGFAILKRIVLESSLSILDRETPSNKS